MSLVGFGQRSRLLRISITGAECTGKSTLAAHLATRYQTVWAYEYLRTFVNQKGAVPDEQDVHLIAEGHLEQATRLLDSANRILFLDTDLVTTCVYQRVYFGTCPDTIETLAVTHRADLYLFTEPDIPWVPDPLQRESPEVRTRTHKLLLQEMYRLKLPFVRVRGSLQERLDIAVQAVNTLLKTYRVQ